jgi:hypothetical protein
LALGGFVVRLMILSLIFYGLSKVRAIHFQTTLMAFVIGFTLCLVVKTIRFYRVLRSVKQKTTEM